MSQSKSVPAQNRIVVGDVGSGKTIVGFFVALGFLHGLDTAYGYGQVAIVAPTEILAAQHYENLMNFIRPRLESDLLTAVYVSGKKYRINDEEYTKAKFAKALKKVSQTHIIWLGTHALFHREDVLPDLVMIDEQHRFGVNQRKELSNRLDSQGRYAHFVSFSATPIPRTVALIAYRDLKPLFLESLGRTSTIHTRLASFDTMEMSVIPYIKEALEKKQKVYIVCPRVEEEETSDLWSIKQAETFFQKHFGDTIITIHGKQKDKDKTILEFKQSDTKHILVATSVIEVGVDVGSATVMVILNAERFGLAALHQIRGRIGRNDLQDNYCFLVSTEGGVYSKRLNYLTESNDGFWLAQKDLELRGGGDITGNMQSGYTEDIEVFLNADDRDIEALQSVIDTLDWDNLSEKLPRLQTYLDDSMKDIWSE
jgi:ATP-dependent DNA helicase RecG